MRDRLEIKATSRTPSVAFDFAANRLKIAGESYPEDATEFYGPVFAALDNYLARLGSGVCRFDFELIYLNSSSAKAVMMVMDKLDAAAKKGASVDVYWHYDGEDDTMQELGEEFGEDLENAKFHLGADVVGRALCRRRAGHRRGATIARRGSFRRPRRQRLLRRASQGLSEALPGDAAADAPQRSQRTAAKRHGRGAAPRQRDHRAEEP